MSSTRVLVLVAAVSLSAGFAAARWSAPQGRDDEILRALEQQRSHQAQREEQVAGRLAVMQRQLQALEERASSRPPSAPAPSLTDAAPTGATEAPERNAKSTAALAQAHHILDRAIANRAWGAAEVEAMREQLRDMDGAAQEEIMKALAAALNRGDIKGRLSSLLYD